MDTSTDVLADRVRDKRLAIDNDLELLRVRAEQMDPRRAAVRVAERGREWVPAALPVAAGALGVWFWARRTRGVRSLRDLLVHALRDLYGIEQQLAPALARMARLAANPDLASLFERHRQDTIAHVERLERALRSIGVRKPKPRRSAAIAAIEAAGERLLKRRIDAALRDAWLVGMAQQAEHVEIANYGTARSFAETLGYTFAAELLQQTLEEERDTDEQLTRLAERFVNLDSIR